MNTSKNNSDFGLDEEIIKTIRDTVGKYPEVIEVVIFGSRAMGNWKPGSDIDMALKGSVKADTVTDISAFLNQRAPRFPYKVDVVAYESITNQALKEHIDANGKTL